MQEKYGFVYLWFDRKHFKFYIGSHWGTECDGYVCSSKNMRENFRYRPSDFKRRILSRVYSDRKELLAVEQKWIDLIKPEEFGREYYNVNAKVGQYAWWMNEDTKAEVRKKQVAAKLGKPRSGKPENWKHTTETKKKLSQIHKGRRGPNTGKIFSEEWKKNMAEAAKGRPSWNKGKKIGPAWNKGLTKETDTRVAKYSKRRQSNKKWFQNKTLGITKKFEIGSQPEGFVEGRLKLKPYKHWKRQYE